MTSDSIVTRRDAIIAKHGPWIAYNIDLGAGIYTMGDEGVGPGEFLIHAIVQAVSDLSGKPLDQLRILDLACHEGGFSIEFGRHGSTVVGIEGREANLAKARFSAEALGLDRVSFLAGDVRKLDEDAVGRFDVVLCLGILYHLEARDAVRLIEKSYSLCDRLTVIRSAIGLRANVQPTVNGKIYGGRLYHEDVKELGASLDNATSILPTRTSLLNLLADVGYSSVVEVRNPCVPGLDNVVDNVTLMAIRGAPVGFRSIPGVDELMDDLRRKQRGGPSWLWAAAHPQQGVYWRLRERMFHTFSRTVFQGRRPVHEWDDWRAGV